MIAIGSNCEMSSLLLVGWRATGSRLTNPILSNGIFRYRAIGGRTCRLSRIVQMNPCPTRTAAAKETVASGPFCMDTARAFALDIGRASGENCRLAVGSRESEATKWARFGLVTHFATTVRRKPMQARQKGEADSASFVSSILDGRLIVVVAVVRISSISNTSEHSIHAQSSGFVISIA